MEEEILQGYTDVNNSWSFGSVKTVNKAFPQLSPDQIKSILRKNSVYTRFYPYRKKKTYIPYYVRQRRWLFQLDTCFFKYPKANRGYQRLLVAIDCFTKFVWAVPMKSTSAKESTRAFQQVLYQLDGDFPVYVQTDRGTEFVNATFKALLRRNGIETYYATSDRKASIVERVQLTLQQKLYKLMEYNTTHSWTRYIDAVVNQYNNSHHRTINMTPAMAEQPDMQEDLLARYERMWAKREANNAQPPKFKVGDTVRVAPSNLNKFRRGYHAPWSIEYFTIDKVLTNFFLPRYKLKTHDGKDQEGTWFEDELVGYNPTEDQEWDIEKVLGKPIGKGDQEQVLVKWVGFPTPSYVTKKIFVICLISL